jgi:hypothetical protein
MFELLPVTALTIEISEEEILGDLLYPDAPRAERGALRSARPARLAAPRPAGRER